jgi:hypothetical protein
MRGLRVAVVISLGVVGCSPPPSTDAGTATLAFSDGTTFDFGGVKVGALSDHTVTLTNTGGAAATGLSPTMLSAPFSIKSSTCSDTLGAGASCTDVITAAPTVAGIATGKLTIHSSAPDVSLTLSVTGTQAGPAVLTISDGSTFDFGTVGLGMSAPHTFTVTNTGTMDATQVTVMPLTAPFAVDSSSTCGATLAGGMSCTVTVKFTPAMEGTVSATLSIGYNDGTSAQSVTRGMTGTGTTPAQLSISDGMTYDFSSVAIGTSATHVFTVTNSGSTGATALSGMALAAPYSYAGAANAFPGTGGDCGATLAPGAMCHVAVRFSPTMTGAAGATLTLGYNDGSAVQMAARPMTGMGAPPALLTFSDAPLYDFGTHALNTGVDHVFTLTNPSGVDATMLTPLAGLTSQFIYKGGTYPGGTGPGFCGATLPALSSCSIALTFAPTMELLSAATLKLSYSNGLGMQTVARNMQGTGTTAAFLTVSDAPSFDWGTQAAGASVDHTFTVTNTGAKSATSIGFTGPAAPFTVKSNSCVTSLGVGASCAVTVTYHPTAAGNDSSSFSFAYNDGVAIPLATATEQLHGAATTRALLTISDGPADYSFGPHPVGAMATKVFTVTNSGAANATTLAVQPIGDPFSTGATTCAGTLAPNQSCTVTVLFSPAAAVSSADTLGVAYNDGGSVQMASRGVTGNGVPPALLILSDGPSYDFGQVAVNGQGIHIFYLQNTGGWIATGISGASLSAPFAYRGGGAFPGFSGSCGPTLNPGAICVITVTFSPTTAMPGSGTLKVNYNDGAAAQSTTRPLAGTGTSRASLVITDYPMLYYTMFGLPADAPTFSYGPVGLNKTSPHTFYVTNVGGGAANMLQGPALTAPYAYVGGGAAPGQGGTCQGTLQPGASCTLAVGFTPTALPAVNGTVTLSYNDGSAVQMATRALTGSGTAAALVAVDDFPGLVLTPTVDFGSVGTGGALPRQLYLVNTGAATASFLSGTFGGGMGFSFVGGAFPGQGGNCGQSLAPGANCELMLAFSPNSAGVANDTLTIHYSDGTNPATATRALRGTGVSTALLVMFRAEQNGGGPQLPSFDWGPAGVGASVDQSFVVANIGASPATVLMQAMLGAPFSVKSSTCGTTLNAGLTCQITLTFHPTAPGTFYGALQLTYLDGMAMQSLTEGLSGTGTSNALIVLQEHDRGGDPGPSDYGVVGSTEVKQFDLTNAGGAMATALTIPALTGPFSVTGTSCTGTLDVGASCSVNVTFAPTMAGGFSTSLTATYNDGTGTKTVSRDLVGEGTADALLVITDCSTCGSSSNNGSYDFGQASNPQSRQFYVLNAGTKPAINLMVSITGGATSSFSVSPDGCTGATLGVGQTCQLTVVFTPGQTSGFVAETLSIAYTDTNGAQPPALELVSGTATRDAIIQISDCDNCNGGGGGGNSFGFGVSGITTTNTFALHNVGAAAAVLTSIGGLSTPFAVSSADAGTCSTSTPLAAGTSCTVNVDFLAAGATPGNYSSSLLVQYTDSLNLMATARRDLTGTVTGAPHLALAECQTCRPGDFPPLYVFPDTGDSFANTQTFGLVNTGAVPAQMIAITGLSGVFSLMHNCGASLNPGASCLLTVKFAPVDSSTTTQTIHIAYTDGMTAQPAATQDVRGTGISGALIRLDTCQTCQGSPGQQQYTFGPTGSPQTMTFYVHNNGGGPTTALNVSNPGMPFAISMNTCGAVLNAGSFCSFQVTFTPSGGSTSNATLHVTWSDTNGPGPDATMQLVGQGSSHALLGINDCTNCGQGGPNPPPIDFGTSGQSVTRNLSLFNSGGDVATNISFSGLSAPFTLTNDTCSGTTLQKNSGCSFTVTFSGAASATQVLSAAYSDTSGPQPAATRQVTGTATTHALLRITDCQWCGTSMTYDFGTHGSPVSNTFYVMNAGAVGATNISFSGLNGTLFAVTNNTCAGTLGINNTCQVTVTFSPSGNGQTGATMHLDYNDQLGGPQPTVDRPLQGTSTTRALLQVVDCLTCPNGFGGGQPPPTDFGTAGISVTRQISVVNNGGAATTMLTVQQPGAPFAVTQSNCPAVLAKGASCDVTLTFTPPVTAGTVMGTLSVAYQDSGGALTPATKPLQGTSTDRAYVLLLDCPQCGPTGQGAPPYDFGTTGVSQSRQFTLENMGARATVGLGVGLVPSGPPFSATACADLSPGGTCTVTVTFNPTTSATSSATLTVAYGDTSGMLTPATRGLTGTGVSGALLQIFDACCGGTSTPAAFDYGTVGVSTTHHFQIQNNGSVTATNVSWGGISGAFTGAGSNCGLTLNRGQLCDIYVAFNPQGTQTSTQNLTVSYTDTSSHTATRTLTGTGTTQPVIGIYDYYPPGPSGYETQPQSPPPYNFGTWGIPQQQNFWVVNLGGAPTTDLAVNIAPGLPFSLSTTCDAGLPQSATQACPVTITFSPDGGTGSFADQLAMKQGAQIATRDFTAAATNRALLRLSENAGQGCGEACGPYFFGYVPTGSFGPPNGFSIFNSGALDANPLSVFSEDPTHFQVQPDSVNPCGATLSPNQGCGVLVTFHPTVMGPASSRLDISYGDAIDGGLSTYRSVNGNGG